MPKIHNQCTDKSWQKRVKASRETPTATHLDTEAERDMAMLSYGGCGKENLEGALASLKGIPSHELCSQDDFKKRGEMIHEVAATSVWSPTLRGIIHNLTLAASFSREILEYTRHVSKRLSWNVSRLSFELGLLYWIYPSGTRN